MGEAENPRQNRERPDGLRADLDRGDEPMSHPRILAFAGSTRTESLNKKLCAIAARAVEQAGAQLTTVDLRDYAMPLYDGDLEAESGLPERAKALKELMKAQDGFVIVSPEYNSSIPGVLKNTIDWVSRPEPDEPPLAAFNGKVAALMSASPSALGGLRGLFALRAVMQNIGVIVVPELVTVKGAPDAFDESGELREESLRDRVTAVAERLVELAGRVRG
jgi:NAD(P)H-dependent FMN reductase